MTGSFFARLGTTSPSVVCRRQNLSKTVRTTARWLATVLDRPGIDDVEQVLTDRLTCHAIRWAAEPAQKRRDGVAVVLDGLRLVEADAQLADDQPQELHRTGTALHYGRRVFPLIFDLLARRVASARRLPVFGGGMYCGLNGHETPVADDRPN